MLSLHADISFFESVLSPPRVLKDVDDVDPYNHDWMGKFHGRSTLVLKPKTTEEVSSIMKYCNEQSLAVVPQGGNTGLVGGSVAVHDEVVLSLSNMDKITQFDADSAVLTCQVW